MLAKITCLALLFTLPFSYAEHEKNPRAQAAPASAFASAVIACRSALLKTGITHSDETLDGKTGAFYLAAFNGAGLLICQPEGISLLRLDRDEKGNFSGEHWLADHEWKVRMKGIEGSFHLVRSMEQMGRGYTLRGFFAKEDPDKSETLPVEAVKEDLTPENFRALTVARNSAIRSLDAHFMLVRDHIGFLVRAEKKGNAKAKAILDKLGWPDKLDQKLFTILKPCADKAIWQQYALRDGRVVDTNNPNSYTAFKEATERFSKGLPPKSTEPRGK